MWLWIARCIAHGDMPSKKWYSASFLWHKAGFILDARVYARIRAHTPTVGAAVYTSVAGCAQRIRAHTPTVAVKVQTCWTFKPGLYFMRAYTRAYADCRRQSSNLLNFQGQRRPAQTFQPITKALQGHRGLTRCSDRDVCGRIPTHTLACLYVYPRRNLRYAVATHRQPQAWTSAPAAGAYARIEYKPGFKASADQCRHSSQSRKRPKVTEGRRVVLHRDVCGRIPTHTLACLYFYPRRNLRYAVATHRQPQAWTSAPAAGANARMEYKPGLILTNPSNAIFLQYVNPYLGSGAGKLKPCTTLAYVAMDSPMIISGGHVVLKVVQRFVFVG